MTSLNIERQLLVSGFIHRVVYSCNVFLNTRLPTLKEFSETVPEKSDGIWAVDRLCTLLENNAIAAQFFKKVIACSHQSPTNQAKYLAEFLTVIEVRCLFPHRLAGFNEWYTITRICHFSSYDEN